MNDFRDTLNKLDNIGIHEDDDYHAHLDNEYETLYDAINEFEHIQNEMFNIKQQLENAIRNYVPDSYEHWKGKGLAQLDIIAGGEDYMSHDESITDLIQACQVRMQEIKQEMEETSVDKGEPEMEESSIASHGRRNRNEL